MTTGLTVVHVTHEAVEQIGGIGAVLRGIVTTGAYRARVGRTILVGPTVPRSVHGADAPLGIHGAVLYRSMDRLDHVGLGPRLRPIEDAFGVGFVYGRRGFPDGPEGEVEVLLTDVTRCAQDALGRFKHRLWERFGLASDRYERDWGYEEYVRLAQPALHALSILLESRDAPWILVAHEFMGLPTALAAIERGDGRWRTVFYGHECATARRLVEEHPGHDAMFYNVLDVARGRGLCVRDVFGNQDQCFRHALVERAGLCDLVIAVGERTREELAFLGGTLATKSIDVVHNGIPASPVDAGAREASRSMLVDYARALVGFAPDLLLTHVARPVVSKGLWRDLSLAHELDRRLVATGKRAVLFVLATAGGTRTPADVETMERDYGWPRDHREGYPDLVGPEVGLWDAYRAFNAAHRAVQVVFANQFGWDSVRLGRRLPDAMTGDDLRRATDVELGLAVYEPFGISPLEPLGAGAICAISSVSGCRGAVERVTDAQGSRNVVTVDFVRLDRPHTIPELLAMTREQRDVLEAAVAPLLAQALLERVPRDPAGRARLLRSGQALVARMGWDEVVGRRLLPLLEHVAGAHVRAPQ